MRTTFASALLLCAVAACARTSQTQTPQNAPPVSVPAPPRETGGFGWLSARGAQGEPGAVELSRVHVSGEQAGDFASLSVEHVFASHSDTVLEGVFRFPLPDGALLTGLSMLIDGQVVEGELVEREKARKAYEQIVDSMQDPALLEWEHGTTFKMRVFPIAPREQKCVTVRYLVPLTRGANGWVFSQSTRRGSSSEPVPELRIDWQGKLVFQERSVRPGRVIQVPVAEPATILREQRGGAIYTAVRVRPDWGKAAALAREKPRRMVFVLDTSRSSLEERKLSLEALRAALKALGPDQSFLMVTHDLEANIDSRGFMSPSATNIEAALAFATGVEPDGGTDLGALFEAIGRIVHGFDDAGVVYIGDCEPSRGLLEADALLARARETLAKTAFNPVVIGAATDVELAQRLAQVSGGRWLRAEHASDVSSFVRRLSEPVLRLPEVEVSAAPGAQVFPSGTLSLEVGQELTLLVKTPLGREALEAVRVRTRADGKEQRLVAGAQGVATNGVAQRFGSELIRSLERDSKPREDVVQASLGYGVLSKYTSFLVLESEEAYARFAIERKQRQESEAPQVSGADLASVDGAGASLSLDRIQPGDPEVLIDAPRDCQSVTVVFPFGERRVASYDPEANHGRGAWMVRFLVDRDTREGRYEVLAYIVHRDGRRELRTVSYTVDRTAPTLNVELKRAPRRPGWFELRVTQNAPENERDLRRVEVRTPDGRSLPLTPIRWAEFRGFVKKGAMSGGRWRIAGFDQALNQVSIEVEAP